MNKLILPILLGVFVLFFSGKSISRTTCGPTVYIEYLGPQTDEPLVEVQVIDHLGNISIYPASAIPITYVGTGGNLHIDFFLNGPDHFAIFSEAIYGPRECNAYNYHDVSSGSIEFNTNCNDYRVSIWGSDAHSNYSCP